MNMLLKDRLTQDEIKYITKEEELKEAYIKYTSVIVEAKKVAQEEKRKAQEIQKELKEEREKAKKDKETMVLNMLKSGLPIERISIYTNLTKQDIELIKKKFKVNK